MNQQTNQQTKIYSLSQVTRSIRLALERATANKTWLIRAEIVSLSSGMGRKTVYLDFVEESGGKQQAKMRGIVWPGIGQQILVDLGAEADQILQPGSEVVFSARIQFHEVYGIALHIEKIEIQFMLGELERRKQATIQSLKNVGAFEWNRRIPAPTIPQKIALVGSRGTSGFRDFITRALGHPRRYRIDIKAYQSSVQGLSAAEELVRGIQMAQEHDPDLIILVRGGGGKLDLDAYNDYEVCMAIAQSTVPVWTGIGHESDLVVADLVAHSAWKTPTEVAVAVTECFQSVDLVLDEMTYRIQQCSLQWIADRNHELQQHGKSLKWIGKHALAAHDSELRSIRRLLSMQSPLIAQRYRAQLNEWKFRLTQSSRFATRRGNTELDYMRDRLERVSIQRLASYESLFIQWGRTMQAMHPDNTLRRGFMMLEKDHQVIPRVASLTSGDNLLLKAHDGSLSVTVNEVKTKNVK
ncbi:MAG: exodeoxyribonuclease VII large subunit [Flavobacteriales bacterium]